MRLWLIEREWRDVDYDECEGGVIRVETEEEARRIADQAFDPKGIWFNANVSCRPVDLDGPAEVVLGSYL